MPLVDDLRQSSILRLEPVAQAEQYQRRCHSTAFAAGVADAPWESCREFDEPWSVRLGHLQQGLHDRRRAVTYAQQVREAPVAEPARRFGTRIKRRIHA